MKKFITITSALALVGGVSYAMEESDGDMMMEAPAPSVSVTGAAKMGVKNVSSDVEEYDSGMALIEEFQVSFASSGTTDGGLMFGASLAIEQDGRADGKVKGSTVYIGGAGGAWKLSFGDPDPGAWSAGGIGVTEEENILLASGHKIALSGSFEGASYVLTSNEPSGDDENQWSMGVTYDAGAVNVGVGMDSEKGLALGVSTDLSGVSTSVFYAKSERADVNDKHITGTDETAVIPATDHYDEKRSGVGVKASMAAGEGVTISLAYSTMKDQETTDLTEGTASQLAAMTKKKKISVDFDYDLGGGATFNAGVDQVDTENVKKVTTLEASIAMSF